MTKENAPKQSAANFASVFGPAAQHLQQASDDLKSESSAFWTAWFQRRQDAMQELMDTASKVTKMGGGDPAAALKLMTDWQAAELARLTKDVSDTNAMMTRCIGGLVTHETEAAEEISEAAKTTSKKHATPV
ncbi:hypothetical protein OO012_07105 [Rhodobacteraceae bacterium KMM 6894]|nr:hypothetical protein [Rhodobacteraceae bacterium KMM 6894]